MVHILRLGLPEASYISELLNQFALGHPDIAFKYINNQTTILYTSGNHDKKTAVLYVYGKDTAKKMIEIDYKKGNYSITGLLGKPELCRANRSYENLYINGRYIKNKIISSAIEEAYKTRLLVGKFPIYVLYFTLPPALVDVNVHPAKLEVRFQNDDEIYQFFYDAVCKCFQNEVLISKADWNSKNSKELEKYAKEKNISMETTPIQKKILQKEMQQDIKNDYSQSVEDLLKKEKNTALEANEDTATYYTEKQHTAEQKQYESQQVRKKVTRDTFFKNYKIIGQIFYTYWIVEQGKSIFMIDQHAAHERILYEELMTELKKQNVTAQMLLQLCMIQKY